MSFVDDPTPFLIDFGVTAVVGGVSTLGIFDAAYGESFGVVGGCSPSLLVASTVVASQGTSVTVHSTAYTVSAVEPDGTGFTQLKLEAA